jgi:hypothetical protein
MRTYVVRLDSGAAMVAVARTSMIGFPAGTATALAAGAITTETNEKRILIVG